ncbi:MAG: Gfo/Idh/MocA family oxidoreductase [Proteobacteria bacterium]|nr:Gfo/Idh/MocA family oxidoreductase [Pseudomonadota bacterium]
MTDTIKVAVIGAGMMGKNHLKTYKGLNGVELVGVYDIFPEACKAAAETFGIKAFSSLEEVAENVDAVSVVTTSVTHAEVGEFFLNRGIHCLMEKPLATTEAECQRLISAAKNNNVTLLVGHIEQFNPAVEQMHKILSDTSKICSLTAQRMSAASGRITDVDVSMDLMIHDVEVIQSLVKSPVVNVQASAVKTPSSPKGKELPPTSPPAVSLRRGSERSPLPPIPTISIWTSLTKASTFTLRDVCPMLTRKKFPSGCITA